MPNQKKRIEEIKLRGVQLKVRTNNPSTLSSVVPDIVFRLNKVHHLEERVKKMSEKIISHGINRKVVDKQKSRFLREESREILAKPIVSDVHSVGDYLEVEVSNIPREKSN